MGIVSPKTAADRFLHALTGCIPDLEGDVTLEPANHHINWRFDDLDADNNPDGLTIGKPEDPEGFFVYVSDVDGGPSTLTSQTLERIDLDEDSFHIIADPVDGAAPRSSQFAAKIAAPDSPELSVVPASNQGWAAGTYRVSYTWIDDKDRHTALAPVSTVTLGLGQFLRVFLPTSLPDGAAAIGVWVTSPGGGIDTLRLQEYVYTSIDFPESVLLKGPYKILRGTPSSNETESDPPKKPKGKKKKHRGGKGKKGRYRARLRKRNRRNGKRSKASDWSDPVDISEDEANSGVGFGVETAQTGDFDIEVEKDGKTHRMVDTKNGRRNSKRPHRRAKHRRRKGGRSGSRKSTHTTSGRTTNEGGNLSSDTSDTGRDTEDLVDDPTSPLDSVLPEGQIIISPGTYWIALSYYVRGEETMISSPVQITITSGQTIRVHFPDANNLLVNSQFRDLNNNGKPDVWTVTGNSSGEGSHFVTENGLWTLNTLGAKTGTTRSPVVSQMVAISRDQFYAVGGMLSAQLTAGTFGAALEEYNASGGLLRSTSLITLATTGNNAEFLTVMGVGYTEFHPDTVKVNLSVAFSGATRDGIGYIHELFINPQTSRRLRRIEVPLSDEGQFIDADPPEFVRWSKASITGVGLPPVKSRLTADFAPLAIQDFETSSLLGYNLHQSNPTGSSAIREATAAIGGAFGYRISKNTTASSHTFLYRYMGRDTGTRLSVNFRVRIVTRPDKGMVWFGGIKHILDLGGRGELLASLGLDRSGNLYFGGQEKKSGVDSWYMQKFSSGVQNGDVLDVELRVFDANSTSGYLQVLLGKNGQSRTLVATSKNWSWPGLYARYPYIGHFSSTSFNTAVVPSDSSHTYTFHYDDIVVTETGNIGSSLSDVPEGMALSQVDRPSSSSSVIEDVTFDTGSIPTPWASSRFPTDSSTAVIVETGAKIDGTHGVRCTDTNTTTSASAYVARPLSPTRTGLGFRARIRVVSLPTTGTVDLMQVVSSSGSSVLASVRLDNLGNLYARSLTAAGAQHRQSRIATSVTASTVLTLEMVVGGAGTDAGFFSCWLARGGTGATAERSQYSSHSLIPWSTLNVGVLRAGICAESAAAATSTLHVDSIRLTEAGEIVFEEADSLGNPIYQAYFYYPQGTPQQDDLGLRDFELAVQPGETYTVALKARHADIPADTPAFPYTFYVYDQDGERHELGCLYGAGGVTGTMPWTALAQTWVIPDNCYIMTADSPGISSGEFVCQELTVSRGLIASRETIYPESGQLWVLLDTEPPTNFAVAPQGANPFENRWLDIGAVVDTPEGTSAVLQYNSANPIYDSNTGELLLTGTEQPTSWLSDPRDVTPGKYAHILITLYASSDLRRTPTLGTETPFVDYYTRTRFGGEYINVLLREDLSEFEGGVHIFSDMMGYRELSAFDVRSPLGMVKRHRMWDPVGEINDLTLRAYTLSAIRDIEENCLSLDFCVEAHDYRMMCRFKEQVSFSIKEPPRKIQGVYCCVAEASVDSVEVYEILPIEPLVDAWVAP